ncbi:MAG TPA: hypothetical protein VEJ41_02725 [Candidatus Acidoferrales bacterium]|nr:hypothetical protein [Candidatus Acidoferrales bacterium]
MSKAAAAKLAAMKASAPADEYFGRMKLSFLGINNTFRDQAIRAGDHTTNQTVTGPVGWAEDALRAWQAKYSHDPQLARTYYLAFLVDQKIWLPDFQQRATGYLLALSQKFPSTFFGKQAKADLSKGMTMNFYLQPLPCDSAAAALVTPAPAPTADPKHNIKVNAIPAPCYTPTPPPAPSMMPLPAASSAPSMTAAPAASPVASMVPAPAASPVSGASPIHT